MSSADIELRSKSYAQGYYYCAPAGVYLSVIIATSNNGGSTPAAPEVTSGHGYAWANLAHNVQVYISSPPSYSSKVEALAGTDVETDPVESWAYPSVTRNWYSGFVSAYSSGLGTRLYNVGDAGGCPFTWNSTTWTTGQSTSPGNCLGSYPNTWTQEDIRYVSWAAAPAYPFPEVYTTCTPVGSCLSAQAVQWGRVAQYHRLLTGGKMLVQGVLVQQYACVEPDIGCQAGTNNTPNEGYDQLWNALNYLDGGGNAQTPPWLSNVSWHR